MINKIKNKRLFDKNKKDKHPHHNNMKDDFDPTQIVLDVDEHGGVHSCEESQLFHLCLPYKELTSSGWNKYKDELIAEGTITQSDIDNEKLEPGASARIQILMDNINNE